MLNYDLIHWTTFFTAALLLNLSPGPDLIFIISESTSKGVKSGFASMFGIWLGTFVHVLFAALGLSAILMTSALAFSMVKWIGAIYLIWIGIQSIRSNGSSLETKNEHHSRSLIGTFYKGILVSLLNPKVAIFFLAFLPQFIEPQAGKVSYQLFLHGSLIIFVAAFVEIPMIFLSQKLLGYFRDNKKISTWIDRGLGAILIAMGVKLATSNQ